jgi:endonuclease YncB( thermonuclease family)
MVIFPRVAAVFVVFAAALARAAAAEEPCKLVPIGTGTVAAVRDGRTLTLGDGRVVRLAAIETAGGTRAALEKMAAGKELRLERLGADHDRYGRLVAFAFPPDTGRSLQQALVAQGAARVSARVGSRACAEPLLAAERAARAAHRGLWADPNFAPLRAENLAGIRSQAGHFALVEGKVLSVHLSGSTFYLNFGRRWTRDFSVIILRRNERGFAAAGLAPKRLQGRTIRVRGWVEQRRGPLIVADAPEQIELMD